jgi:hypothetical protein
MLFEVKIRLTNLMLGQQRTTGGVRRFTRVRDDDKRILVDHQHWNWAFKEAADALHIPVNISTMYPAAGIAAPTLVMYTRRWTTKTPDGRDRPQSEIFEAVREGTVLTFQLLSATGPERLDLPAPDAAQLEQLLNFIGEFIGISQWGNKFGYGRFRVEAVRVL